MCKPRPFHFHTYDTWLPEYGRAGAALCAATTRRCRTVFCHNTKCDAWLTHVRRRASNVVIVVDSAWAQVGWQAEDCCRSSTHAQSRIGCVLGAKNQLALDTKQAVVNGAQALG